MIGADWLKVCLERPREDVFFSKMAAILWAGANLQANDFHIACMASFTGSFFNSVSKREAPHSGIS